MGDNVIRIPIEITITVGEPRVGSDGQVSPMSVATSTPGADDEERFILDNDYSRRVGYDRDFLGRGARVEMPELVKAALDDVAFPVEAAEGEYLLHYHHFSIALNKKRRLLFFAASNTTRDPDLMGKKSRKQLSGGSDKWILDPRVAGAFQVTTKELYGPTDFDRGHVVRREDSYWGLNEREAEYANFDTFHYTNCTPQHPNYNRSSAKGLWGLLENHIGEQATDNEKKLSVFAGPVMAKNDPFISEVKIPRQFWKIVVARRRGGGVRAWAFLLSQAKLVREERERFEEGFDAGEFKMYQVPVTRIQDLTDVRFDPVVLEGDTNAAGENEAPLEATRLIENLDQIVGLEAP